MNQRREGDKLIFFLLGGGDDRNKRKCEEEDGLSGLSASIKKKKDLKTQSLPKHINTALFVNYNIYA